MTGLTSNVVLPSIRPLLEEVIRLEAVHQSYPPFVPLRLPIDLNRSPFVPDVCNAPFPSPAPRPILGRVSPQSPPIHPLPKISPIQGDMSCYHSSEAVALWNHRSQNGFPLSPSLSSGSIETSSLSPPSYLVSPASHNSLPKTPRLGSLYPFDLGHERSPRFEDPPPSQAKHSQPEQMAGPSLLPPRPILEPSMEHRGPFALRHLANSPPSTPLSPSSSVDSSPKIAEGHLPPALMSTLSNQPVPPTSLPKAQTRTRKTRSCKASGAPRVDNQLTINGTFYTRGRPDDLKLIDGEKPRTRSTWGEAEKVVTLAALEWYRTEKDSSFIISKSSKREQHKALPVIWKHIRKVLNIGNFKRGYEGFLIWTAINLGRPTTRNPAPCDRPRSRAPAKPKAAQAPRAKRAPKAEQTTKTKQASRKRPAKTA